jgi:hypothetical protein
MAGQVKLVVPGGFDLGDKSLSRIFMTGTTRRHAPVVPSEKKFSDCVCSILNAWPKSLDTYVQPDINYWLIGPTPK